MSEELSEVNPHGIYREEDDLDDQNQEPDITINTEIEHQENNNNQANVEPLTMELVQEALMTLQAQMTAVTTMFTRLPEIVKNEVVKLQRPGPLPDEGVQANILNELVDLNSNMRVRTLVVGFTTLN